MNGPNDPNGPNGPNDLSNPPPDDLVHASGREADTAGAEEAAVGAAAVHPASTVGCTEPLHDTLAGEFHGDAAS